MPSSPDSVCPIFRVLPLNRPLNYLADKTDARCGSSALWSMVNKALAERCELFARMYEDGIKGGRTSIPQKTAAVHAAAWFCTPFVSDPS